MKIKMIPPEYHALVERVARRLWRRVANVGIAIEDLIQEGLMGYLGAVKRLDPNHTSAKAFLTTRINGAMLDFLRTEDPLSQRRRRQKKRLERIAEAIAAKTGRPAELAEIALESGLSVEEVSDLLQPVHRAHEFDLDWLATDAPDHTESASALIDHYTAESSLTEQEHTILGFFREGRLQKEIAKHIGTTEARVSQKVKDITDKLRRAAKRTERPITPEPLKPISVLPAKANKSEVTMSTQGSGPNGQVTPDYQGKLDRCRQLFRNNWFNRDTLVQRGVFDNHQLAGPFVAWLTKNHHDKIAVEGPNGARQYRLLSKDEIDHRAKSPTDVQFVMPPGAIAGKPVEPPPKPSPEPAPEEPQDAASPGSSYLSIIARLYQVIGDRSFQMSDIAHDQIGARDRMHKNNVISAIGATGKYLRVSMEEGSHKRTFHWTDAAHEKWGKKREAEAPAEPLEGRYRFQIGASEPKIWAQHTQKQTSYLVCCRFSEIFFHLKTHFEGKKYF